MQRRLSSLSLYRQIALIGSVIFVLALLGITVGHWLTARAAVREQLASHAQETATSLALSLNVALANHDAEGVHLRVLPLMDRGYFRQIEVRDVQDALIDRQDYTTENTDHIPAWFVRVANLQPVSAHALISSGWQQLGSVQVSSHPQLAIEQLWQDTVQAIAWLVLVAGVAGLLLLTWLRQVLAPLREVEQVALSAVQRRFNRMQSEPQAPELKHFVQGFNHVIDTVNNTLDAETQRAEFFQQQAVRDALTGLPNRQGFEQAWQQAWQHSITEKRESNETACLFILELQGLDALNMQQGYARGDALIMGIAKNLQAWAEEQGIQMLARLGAARFAACCSHQDEDTFQTNASQLMLRLNEVLATFTNVGEVASYKMVLGAVFITAPADPQTLSSYLAQVDHAVLLASDQRTGIAVVAQNETTYLGEQQWLARVRAALKQGRHTLVSQAVFDVANPRQALQREIFMRLQDEDGDALPLKLSLPVLQHAGELATFDRVVVQSLYAALQRGALVGQRLAINLAAESWCRPEFVSWLVGQLNMWPLLMKPVFELREADVVRAAAQAEDFANAVRKAGADVSIDHYGTTAGGIACLRLLLPSYVKLDASLVRHLAHDAQRFQLEALVRVARTLDIPVWAQWFEQTEDIDALAVLAEMGVSGAQGYLLATEETV